MKIAILLAPFAFALAGTSALAEVALVPVQTPQLWQRAEFRIEGAPSVANNFDPDQIRLDAIIESPAGKKISVAAFWSEDFASELVGGSEKVHATGEKGWRLRFVPTEAGRHRLSLKLAQQGAAETEIAHVEFSVADARPAGRFGWVRVNADRRGFETSDGRPLRLVGENVCWASNGGTFNYVDWFDSLQRSGQNVARLWMCPWWLALEQKSDSLTRYQMDAAWQLDRLFALAEERGIYLILCLEFHGMFQIDNPHWGGSGNWWTRNPYHRNNGGPGVHPNDFFTDARARDLYRKRLRYLIARYSANTHLLAWQFFNEIDNVYAPHLLQAANVAAWHGEMGRWLKQNDPHGHLVTTSLTGGSDRPEIWSLPEMDFAVYHSYGDPAPAKWLARLTDDYMRRYGKPALVGEYGVDWRGWGGRTTDPHLRAQRQALWGSALAGGAGVALSWWWEEIHADNVYPIYRALTSILAQGGWFEGNWTPAQVAPGLEDSPASVGEVLPNGSIYSGPLVTTNTPWVKVRNEAALTGALAAMRGAESLSSYLGGTAQADRRRPMRLDAWWTDDAHVQLHVAEIGGAAEFVARVDGTEVLRQAIPRPAAFVGKSAAVDVELKVPVPAGRHRVELENVGEQWLRFENARVQGVRESEFADGWRFAPETVALRQADRAILYTVSPAAVYPAGAATYHPAPQRRQVLALRDWPAGTYEVAWFNPETGAEIRRAAATTRQGALRLECPDFEVDLAATVRKAP